MAKAEFVPGFELHRANKHLGTPKHAVMVACSENNPPDAPSVLVPEEMLKLTGDGYRSLKASPMFSVSGDNM